MYINVCVCVCACARGDQVYSSLDLSRGQLEEKGEEGDEEEEEEKKSDSPLTLDSLSWTPDFTEM